MSTSEKIDLYRDFAAGVYLSEAPSSPLIHTPPYTLYTCILNRYLFTLGRGERAKQREG